MKKTLIILSFALSCTWGQDIGTVTAMRGDVNITRGVALYQAHIGLEIKEQDTFFTSAKSSMQITFSDNTVITLGKNTVFSVSEYLYNEQSREAKAKFKFKKGVFKSITGSIGKIAPKKFQIETKNSTIGVRGTEITGTSTNQKEEIVCTFGEISVASGDKEFVAKANEKVAIKLDPRVEYKIASAVDMMVRSQVALGIKQEDDPEVQKRPAASITKEYKPEVKQALIAQGIDPEDTPVISEDIIEEAKPVEVQELKRMEENFVPDASFKPQEILREEIKEIEEQRIEKETKEQSLIDHNATKAQQTPPYDFKPIKPEEIAKRTPWMPKTQSKRIMRPLQNEPSQMAQELMNQHLARSIQDNYYNMMPPPLP